MEKDYEIICILGEGTFGKVYKARHRRSGDDVAVKQIKIGSRSWDEACRSTELQALKALRHQFIVRLKELIRSQWDGSLYYIFEFLDSDLCRLVKDYPGGLEEMRSAALTRQLFAGLAHMHQHNFFHRDIKPENVLLDIATETIRLADFGQARSLRARPPFTDYVGTRWYRAPECLLRDRTYSSPVDVWAAGLIFAELLRGSPVFCGTSSIDQLYKIFTVLGPLQDWPDFPRLAQAVRFRVPDRGCGLNRVVPSRLSPQCLSVLTEMLSINPRRRPFARKCLENAFFTLLPPLDLDGCDTHRSRSSTITEDKLEEKKFLFPPGVTNVASLNQRSAVAEAEPDLDLDLDAELDAILGDRGACDDFSKSVAGGLSQALPLGQYEVEPKRVETSPLLPTALGDEKTPPTLPGRITRAATVPNLTIEVPQQNVSRGSSFDFSPGNRPKEENSEQRFASSPQGTPKLGASARRKGALPMSPGGVSVDALLDSLAADFPSPGNVSAGQYNSPMSPMLLAAPTPPALPADVPPPPAEELLPLQLAPPVPAVSEQPEEGGISETATVRGSLSEVHSSDTFGTLAAPAVAFEVLGFSPPVTPATGKVPGAVEVINAPACRTEPENEVPRVEAAWPGTPEKVSAAGSSQGSPSQGSPQWQPSWASQDRRGSARQTGPPPKWSGTRLLPDSPGSCSSKADTEAEVLLPGLGNVPAARVATSESTSAFPRSGSFQASASHSPDTPTTAATHAVRDPSNSHSDAARNLVISMADPLCRTRSITSAWSVGTGDQAVAKADQADIPSSSIANDSLADTSAVSEPPASACDTARAESAAAASDVADSTPKLWQDPGQAELATHEPPRFMAADVPAEIVVAAETVTAGASDNTPEGSAQDELATLRAENAALRERLATEAAREEAGAANSLPPSSVEPAMGSTALAEVACPSPQSFNSTASTSAVGTLCSAGEVKPAMKSRSSVWASEESAQLRRMVKHITRKGTHEKEALWAEVASELGSGRSARECKLQYARDYRAHKAKTADATEHGLTGDSVASAAASGFRRGNSLDMGVLSSGAGNVQSQRLLPRLQPLSEAIFQSGVALSQSAM